MRDETHPLPDLNTTLDRLEALLAREHEALRTLDHDAIEAATDEKLTLNEALRVAGAQVSAEERDRLERIGRAALANQLLLVHARACVRGILALALGQPGPEAVSSSGGPAPAGPLRLDVRG